MSNTLSRFAMMAAMLSMFDPEFSRPSKGYIEIEAAEKCLRPECTHEKEYNRAYCSAECNKKDKARIKLLNKK